MRGAIKPGTLAWLLGAVVVVGLAFVVGRQLRPEAANASIVDFDAAAFDAPKSAAGMSKAGFSGFSEVTGEGLTVVSGRIVSTTADTVTVESPGGQRTTVRLTGNGPLKRLEPAGRDVLRPGVTVLVKRDGNEASGVLVVSAP